jgi:hypothetical protein
MRARIDRSLLIFMIHSTLCDIHEFGGECPSRLKVIPDLEDLKMN